MIPITDKKYFDDVDLKDLIETQRKITLRIKKIHNSDREGLQMLANELEYWTKDVLYQKAKYLCKKTLDSKTKFEKIKTIIDS